VTTASLMLDLRWEASGRWYRLRADCAAGITLVHGPAASRLLRLLAGEEVPAEGQALLDGEPLRHGREVALHGPTVRPVAALLNEDAPRHWRTPLGWVASGVRAHGLRHGEARARAGQALGWVGARTEGMAMRPLATLSAPERRRVALAHALAVVPGLLLLDHPCEALCRSERAALYETIRVLAERWEMVVLLIPDVDMALDGVPALTPQPASHDRSR
jgi:cobalt/nickel transport system ATP-binding protein